MSDTDARELLRRLLEPRFQKYAGQRLSDDLIDRMVEDVKDAVAELPDGDVIIDEFVDSEKLTKALKDMGRL